MKFRRAAILLPLLASLITPAPNSSVWATAGGGSAPAAWRTWVLPSADQFRLPPPPGLHSGSTRRELRELHQLQEARSKKVEKRVRFWNRGPATTRWTDVALEMIRIHRPGAFPTRTARALGLLHIGMYDAMVAAFDSRAAYGRPRPYRTDRSLDPLFRERGSSYPDARSALAGAAERLLTYLFPQESPATFKRLADQAVKSRLWAGLNYRTDVVRARELGRRVADVVIGYGESDGSKAAGDFESQRLCSTPACQGADEQYWVPTPLIFQYPPTDPMASKWKTWLLQTPSQFRPPPPPAYGSAQFMTELQEVKQANDTADQEKRQLAFFWDDSPGSFGPAGHWNDIAVDVARGRKLSTPKAARLFALMNAAIVDAFIATWDAKYTYWSMRPVTAIRERPTILGTPNPLYDPGWLPNLVTPPFPAYTSGHSAESAAAARVLQYLLPDAGQDRDAIVDMVGPTGSFDQIAEEVALSRMIGGIHFRSDNEAALVLGRKVAALAIHRARADGSGL
jgi:PAP2 superfamily